MRKFVHLLFLGSVAATLTIVVFVIVLITYLADPPDLHLARAEGIVDEVRSGKVISSIEVNRVMGPRYPRQFTGWDESYRLGPDFPRYQLDSKWLVIRINQQSSVVIDAMIMVD